MNKILEHALSYIAQGWFVLPLQEKGKEPFFKFAPNGYKSATNDPNLAIKWWSARPNLNIGIACAPSGLVVFDVDERSGGTTQGLAPTLTVRTGNGYHFYYDTADDAHFPGKYRQGIDIKHNGYVVAPPSIHPSGHVYRVVSPTVKRRRAA
ncbi:MAG: hypothetical protein EBZ61_08305 [Micrococcales bacterium]|nr:hypothetical protein [Micrococcales bacterium]